MVEFDALMANPYPLAVPLMLLGLALLGFALREGYTRPRHAGVGCLGMAFGLWLAASQVEKSTVDASKYGYTQKREYQAVTAAVGEQQPEETTEAAEDDSRHDRAEHNYARSDLDRASERSSSRRGSVRYAAWQVGFRLVCGLVLAHALRAAARTYSTR